LPKTKPPAMDAAKAFPAARGSKSRPSRCRGPEIYRSTTPRRWASSSSLGRSRRLGNAGEADTVLAETLADIDADGLLVQDVGRRQGPTRPARRQRSASASRCKAAR
jgi:hypothetical protein